MEYPQARTESPLFQVGRNVCLLKKQEQPQRIWWPAGMLTLIWSGTTSSQAGSTGLRMGYCSGILSRFHSLCSTLCYGSLLAGLKANSGLSSSATGTVSDMCLVFVWIVFVWEEDFSRYWFTGSNQTFELLYPFQVKYQAVLPFSKMMNSLWQHKVGYF